MLAGCDRTASRTQYGRDRQLLRTNNRYGLDKRIEGRLRFAALRFAASTVMGSSVDLGILEPDGHRFPATLVRPSIR